jgi:hypothetical protein
VVVVGAGKIGQDNLENEVIFFVVQGLQPPSGPAGLISVLAGLTQSSIRHTPSRTQYCDASECVESESLVTPRTGVTIRVLGHTKDSDGPPGPGQARGPVDRVPLRLRLVTQPAGWAPERAGQAAASDSEPVWLTGSCDSHQYHVSHAGSEAAAGPGPARARHGV